MPVIDGVVVLKADGFSFEPGLEGDLVDGGPVEGSPWHCTSGFNQPRDNGLGIHGAVDAAPTPWGPRDLYVVATNDGRVELAIRWNGISGPGGSYGNYVVLRHDDGEATLSAHLERFSDAIEAWLVGGALPWEAPFLERGDVIGKMGNRGNVWPTPADPNDLDTGKHLHFECRARAALGSVLIDPEARFTPLGRLVEPRPEELPPVEPNPEPNEPIDLTYSAALDEARMLWRLIDMMLEHPIDYDDALKSIQREADELVASFGDAAGTVLDEARILSQEVALLRQVLPDYVPVLERLRDEVGEQVAALSIAHELAIVS